MTMTEPNVAKAASQIGPSQPSPPSTHDVARETVGRLSLCHDVLDSILAGAFGLPSDAPRQDTSSGTTHDFVQTGSTDADSLHTKLCMLQHRLLGN